jgi:hypothetical protein
MHSVLKKYYMLFALVITNVSCAMEIDVPNDEQIPHFLVRQVLVTWLRVRKLHTIERERRIKELPDQYREVNTYGPITSIALVNQPKDLPTTSPQNATNKDLQSNPNIIGFGEYGRKIDFTQKAKL